MLYDPPVVRAGDVAHEPLRDAQGSFRPYRIARRIARGEEGLDHVHVRVRPAVGLGLAPLAIPRLHACAFVLGPEVALHDADDLVEERRTSRTSRHRRAGGGEQDERVRVGLLAGVRRPGGRDLGEPPAVLVILKGLADGAQTVVGEQATTRDAEQVPEGEAMRHARRDPQL